MKLIDTKLYYITDGTRFIWKNNRGVYTPTYGQPMADLYTKHEAEKILKSRLKKPFRKTFYLKEAFTQTCDTTAKNKIDNADKLDKIDNGKQENQTCVNTYNQDVAEKEVNKNNPNKPLSKADIKNNTETVMDSDYTVQWLDRVSSLNGLTQDMYNRKEVLQTALKDVDGELQDELHYIEFSKCNAYQAWVSWKRLQLLRQKRRSIKNEIEVLNIILHKDAGNIAVTEIKREIEKLDKRKYTPRTKSDLYV